MRKPKIILTQQALDALLAAKGYRLIHYGPTRFKYRRPYVWDYGKLRN